MSISDCLDDFFGGEDGDGEVLLLRDVFARISACFRYEIASSRVICAPVRDFDPVIVLQDAEYVSGNLLSIRVKKENSDRLPGCALLISVNSTLPRRKKASMLSSSFQCTLSISIAISSSERCRDRKCEISSCRGRPSDR